MQAPLQALEPLLYAPAATAAQPEPAAADGASLVRWLAQTLDHVGRGMVLLTPGARVLHANRLAHQALGPAHPLMIEGGRLRARNADDNQALAGALDDAWHRGLRRLLSLGDARRPVSVAVLPIDADGAHGQGSGAALLSLSQPSRALDLAVHCYARQHGFTGAETAVLEALLNGQRAPEIARAKGVALSTVRSHITHMREKTGARSIGQLLERVAALPPMLAAVQ